MAYTTINKGSSYFNTVLYTGTGASLAITGVGFQPDLTWVKRRDTTGGNKWTDVVRGAGIVLNSNSTSDEFAQTGISSFNSDGFTLGTASGDFNANSGTYAAWNWLANNTSGSSNTSGTITSTVAANTTAGFSIVSWTGTGATGTIGHGLGSVPKMIIVKNRSSATDWYTYHQAIGNGNSVFLNLTDASTATNAWQSTTPTSSLFYIAAGSSVNGSGNNMIAYCFAEIKGFSKISSYTGNNTNDGPFVYTGFKPAFILIKPSDGAYNWTIIDNKRNTYNVTTLGLIPNTSSADTTGSGSTYNMDILSNGFKPRYSSVELNGSLTYIYMAFAENPFVTSGGIPVTAR